MTGPDEALMLAAARGDAAAFTALVEKFRNAILNFFIRSGVQQSDAEDLAQTTFVNVWKARARYSPSARFSTFLFSVARNAFVDYIRRKDARRRLEEGARARAFDAATERRRAAPDLRRAVAALSAPLRETVALAVFAEMPYAEIAETLGIPEGTVKSRMFNAIAKMKEYFKNNPEEV